MAEGAVPPGEPPLLPTPAPLQPQHLCASSDLAERGTALLFDVRHHRAAARAFVLRFDGRVVAYLNRCLHVPAEMDWQPGEFLDSGKEFIICSIHGATYQPANGRCAGGPCGRGSLTPLSVVERDGQVYWYPSKYVLPVADGAAPRNSPDV